MTDQEQMLEDFVQRGDEGQLHSRGVNMLITLNCRAREIGAVAALGIWFGLEGCYEMYTKPGDGDGWARAMRSLPKATPE